MIVDQFGLIDNTKRPKKFEFHLKFYCLDGCDYRCDFDKDDNVFCHLIGEDLSQSDLKILKKVGCAMRKPKEKGRLDR